MARISSTTLFNFTDNIDYLIDNLENGFYCCNTYEKLPLKNNGYRVPMVCFCDIPLSLIKEHFDWYGKFGIGINRSYARSLGVNPVWYITSENRLINSLINTKKMSEYERKHLLPYLKQFMGFQTYNNDKLKNKKFYDEREWRYIPDNTLVEPFFGIKKELIKKNTNKNIERMPIDLEEVEYIIIENGTFFDKILDALKKLSITHSIKYEILVSKLITAKSIEKDF